MRTDLKQMLVQDYLALVLPIYDVGRDECVVLAGPGRTANIRGQDTIHLLLHDWHSMSVDDSVASCILAASEKEHMMTGDARDVERVMSRKDLSTGSVLMSAQTFMKVGEVLPGRTFVHRFIPHGTAIFCADQEFLGVVCYNDISMMFGAFVRTLSVIPAIVLDSTDVEMARARLMDIVEVMGS